MQPKVHVLARTSLLAAAIALVGTPLVAQSIPAADAEKVMGRWSLTVDGGQGMVTLSIGIMEANGEAAATVGSDMAPQIDEVTRISKVGETVTLFYTTDVQGQMFPVEIALTPQDETLAASITAGDGMFMTQGTAVPVE